MKWTKKWIWVLMVSLFFTISPARVYAEEAKEDEDSTLAPYFSIEGTDSSAEYFPLKETDVSTTINGVIAETYVTQVYANEGEVPVNASYVFPASSRVTVHGMTMEIGDKTVTARIKEREEAKEEFEQAKSEGKSASLLEQQRPNVFTMNVSNVMPGDTVRIKLQYSETIVSTEGVYQFVFPTVAGPRYAGAAEAASGSGSSENDRWVASPYTKSVSSLGAYHISVKLYAGVPVAELSSKSHDITIVKDGETTANVTLSNPDDFAGNRDFIMDYKLTGQEVSSGLILGKGEKENFFMMMVQPPERVELTDIPPREYVFVLDVSGSMYGYPLDTAKSLINRLVTGLRDTDRFNVILFSGAASRFHTESVTASSENVKRALEFIDREDGGGGTELLSALEGAVAMPGDTAYSRSIIVLTDGYISGEKEVFSLIENQMNTTNFFSFGIGESVNRYLIDGIAKTGMGEAFVVTDAADAESTAEAFRAYVQSPLLTDIQVSYGDFEVYDVEPKNLPVLFASRPVVIYGKWRGEPSGTIHLTGETATGDYAQDISVSAATPLESNNIIRYLWARTKVERLTDYSTDGQNEEAVKREITELGLEYSMMTPYTSFVAVLDTVRNQDGAGRDTAQPQPLPANVSELAVGGGYTMGSEPEGMILLFSAAAALCLIAVRYKRKKGVTGKQGADGEN